MVGGGPGGVGGLHDTDTALESSGPPTISKENRILSANGTVAANVQWAVCTESGPIASAPQDERIVPAGIVSTANALVESLDA